VDFISKVTANKAFTQAYHEFVPPGCYVGLFLQVRNSSIVTEDPSVLQLIRSLGLRLRRGWALPILCVQDMPLEFLKFYVQICTFRCFSGVVV